MTTTINHPFKLFVATPDGADWTSAEALGDYMMQRWSDRTAADEAASDALQAIEDMAFDDVRFVGLTVDVVQDPDLQLVDVTVSLRGIAGESTTVETVLCPASYDGAEITADDIDHDGAVVVIDGDVYHY